MGRGTASCSWLPQLQPEASLGRERARVRLRWRAILVALVAAGVASGTSRAQTSDAELVLQVGHRGDVRAIAVSPDGRLVASGGGDGRVLLWDIATGAVLRSLLPSHRVTSLAFAPDGRRLLIGRINCKAQLVDLDGSSIAAEIEDRGGYCAAALSADGRFFAFGGDELLRFADATSGRILVEIEDPERDRYWDVAISPDNARVIGASNDKVVTLWPAKTGAMPSRLRGHEASVRRVWFDGEGRLVSADSAGTVITWDLADRRAVGKERIGAASSFGSLRLAIDGASVAFVDADGGLRVRTPGAEDRVLPLPPGPELTALALHAKADLLAIGDDSGRVRLVRIESGKTERLLEGRLASPRALAAGPDGDLRVAVVAADEVGVVSLPSAVPLWSGDGRGRRVFALSPDGRTFAQAVVGEPVCVVDLATGVATRCAFAAHGPLAVHSSRRLAIYERADSIAVFGDGAAPARRLPGNASTDIHALAFAPDGAEVVMSGKGNFIRRFDLASGETLATRGGSGFARQGDQTPAYDQGLGWVSALAMSGSGAQCRVLCGGPYTTLVLRDGALDSVRAFTGHRGSILAAAFLPGGRMSTAGSEDAVLVWDAASAQPIGRIELLGPRDWIARTPDGRFEASAGALRRLLRVRYAPDRGFATEPATVAPEARGLLAELIGGAKQR